MEHPDEQAFLDDLQGGKLSYEEAKERYLTLGDAIRRRYEREITAVSVDVVDSTDAKDGVNSLDAQLTFDAYHRWVEETLNAHGCERFSWAGDGLIAIFEQPEQAVSMGRALIEGLRTFNVRSNRLRRRIEVRIGAHSGPILPGESEGLGKIASHTFDLAGHLQKMAQPNQMRISETTYTLLRDGGGQFARVLWEQPSPSPCFVYPPDSAGEAPGSSPVPRGAVPSTAEVAARPFNPWHLAAAVALVVAMVGGFAAWYRNQSGELRPQSPGPANSAAIPAVGDPNLQLPRTNPGDPGAPAPVPGAPAPAPGANPGTPTTPAAPDPNAPATALWLSPEAESGVPASFAPAAPEHQWLLAVGVGRYQNGAYAAEGAGSDARSAAAALQRHAGIPQNHVQILADEQATLANIKQAIKWLQNSTTGRDTVYLYLGGHGLNAPDPPRFRNPDGRGFALAPHDADPKDTANTLLFGSDLATWLSATRAQTIVVLADAAEAGGMNVPATPDLGRQFMLLASAGVGQRPNVSRGAQASLFVEALTAGLAGGADPDRDRQVSLEELRAFVQSTVATRTGNAQTPHARAGFGVRSTPSLSFTVGG